MPPNPVSSPWAAAKETSELLWLCSSKFFPTNSTLSVDVNTAGGHWSSTSDVGE